MRRLFLITLMLLPIHLLAAGPVEGDKEPLVFSSTEQEERFKDLTLELRCLVCQNQNLADSDAPLAQDLRKEIFDMLQAGEGDEEIKTFMVERYGDFVLYRPPVQGNTLALWAMPVLFLFVGAIAVFVAVRKRNLKLAEQRQGASE
jgi:cytochrome c-type biogenesis protein CcmH